MTGEREENVTLSFLIDTEVSSGKRRRNDSAVDALVGLTKYAIMHPSLSLSLSDEFYFTLEPSIFFAVFSMSSVKVKRHSKKP